MNRSKKRLTPCLTLLLAMSCALPLYAQSAPDEQPSRPLTSEEAREVKASCDVAADTIFTLTGHIKECRLIRREERDAHREDDAAHIRRIATLEELNAKSMRRQVLTGGVGLVLGIALGGFVVHKIKKGGE